MWSLLLAAALAADPLPPVSLGLDLAATGGPGAGGVVGTARVLVNLRPLSIEVSGGEGWVEGVDREVGRIGLGLRRYVWRGSYVRAGLAHAHEVDGATFAAHPGGSLAGTHQGITHRTGFALGAGWLFPVAPDRTRGRLALAVDLEGLVYPGRVDPLGYAQVGVGLLVHVGRAPARRASCEDGENSDCPARVDRRSSG